MWPFVTGLCHSASRSQVLSRSNFCVFHPSYGPVIVTGPHSTIRSSGHLAVTPPSPRSSLPSVVIVNLAVITCTLSRWPQLCGSGQLPPSGVAADPPLLCLS